MRLGIWFLKVLEWLHKNWVRCARFCVSGTSYYICIKCIYIRKYHVIVSPKVVQKFFEKDVHWLNKSKRKQKKKVPTKYKYVNISLNFCAIILKPSEIKFPALFTSKLRWCLFFWFCHPLDISQKPRPGPKPGQAKPNFWLLARLTISSSPSRLKPGQSRGFQAKPEPARHYSYMPRVAMALSSNPSLFSYNADAVK